MAVQWLEPCAFTAVGPGSVPGQESNPTSCVAWLKKKR